MCGRYTLVHSKEALEQAFGAAFPEGQESYNIVPSQKVLAAASSTEQTKAGWLQWGLIPSWADDKKIGHKMINARAESVDTKPAFRRLLERRRCLVIADGFYEWDREGGTKQPYRITVDNEELFAFAGLWDRWEGEEETITSCTIITTEANDLMQSIHHRMPVILDEEARKTWLDPHETDKQVLKSLLQPFDDSRMTMYPVSNEVNSPKHNHAALIERVK